MVHQALESDGVLRPASEVMPIKRLGAIRANSISFLRIVLRKMMREAWKIEQSAFELDDEGYGDAIYKITTPQDCHVRLFHRRYCSDVAS